MAPSDFHLFGPMKEHLRGQKFADDDEVMETVQSWLKTTPKSFFLEGICKLVDRWTKCVAKQGDYVKKNKTQTISVNTLAKNYCEYKISCYLMTYPRKSFVCQIFKSYYILHCAQATESFILILCSVQYLVPCFFIMTLSKPKLWSSLM